ncbi:MAG: hypothetical protein MJA83_13895, partial [Gammaproteobacteria bacterium]|nr:hypothetical protein [Gammaproteobacteria bacterium]
MSRVFVQDDKVYPLCVEALRRQTDVVEDLVGVFEEFEDLVGTIEVCDDVAMILGGDMGGFLYVGNVLPTDPMVDVANITSFQDPPNNSVPQAVTVSNLQSDVLLRASYPIVIFDPLGSATSLTLTQLPSGIYEGTFTLTLLAGNNVF